MTEEWRPVVGWEGLYEVSSAGRVRSCDRIVNFRDGRRRSYRGQILKPATMIGGYLAVSLQHGGQSVKRNVHLLVCCAFHGLRPDGKVARHLDGNPRNNEASNLAWGTQGQNISDQVLHGTHPHARKTTCPRHHPLEEPNLVPSSTKLASRRGGSHRECLACSRARSYVNYHKDLEPEIQNISDSYFAEITNKAA